jgi:capsule polysaccharide export protein KpsE/RkpR
MNLKPYIENSILLKLMLILWNKRKLILIFNISIFILALLYAFLLPKWYRGNVTFIVNENTNNSMIQALTGALPFNLFSNTSVKIKQYMRFLHSRRILDKIDKKYNLQNIYKIENRQKFYRALRSDIVLIDNDDNTITLNYYYKEDSVLASIIANELFDELDQLSTDLNREINKNLKIYLEESYIETISRLKNAEQQLVKYQIDEQIFDVEMQLKKIIEVIAELEFQKTKTEIELKILSQNFDRNSLQVTNLKNTIKVLDDKIKDLKYSEDENSISLKQMPNKAVSYLHLYRDVKVLNKVLEFIIPQLENSRLEESKSTSELQVLDRAIPEDHKAKPKRITVVFTILLLTNILIVFSILFYNTFKEVKPLFLKK